VPAPARFAELIMGEGTGCDRRHIADVSRARPIAHWIKAGLALAYRAVAAGLRAGGAEVVAWLRPGFQPLSAAVAARS
jgi:hypothetical protein